MSIVTAILPENPAELRIFAACLQTEFYAKDLHIEKLKMQLAVARRVQFGQSSEKMDSGGPAQIELELEEDETDKSARQEETPPSNFKASPAQEKLHPVRKALPNHLPRERVEHEAACVCPNCGCTSLTQIGVDEREVLEYVPSHFKAVVHVRPKMSCRTCETISLSPERDLRAGRRGY
jgi:hypothetical protein